jgi:catechol 2,3-dioxygenase-like lactoylglutathione lyase family enzyme
MEIPTSRVPFRPAGYRRSLSFYRDTIGLAIAREYGGGTVFYAGQSLIDLVGHGRLAEPAGSFPGALWLQVRDVDAAQAELACRLRGRPAASLGACTRCTRPIPTG